jgi:CRISPR type III-A-associated protein Csm2
MYLNEFPEAKRHFEAVYPYILSMKDTEYLGKIIEQVEQFVKDRGADITTSQLRNIYARIKKADNQNELLGLRPVLAYTSARQDRRKEGGKLIIALLDGLIQEIKPDAPNEVESLQTFAEAIVAYHKYHHPKQS